MTQVAHKEECMLQVIAVWKDKHIFTQKHTQVTRMPVRISCHLQPHIGGALEALKMRQFDTNKNKKQLT